MLILPGHGSERRSCGGSNHLSPEAFHEAPAGCQRCQAAGLACFSDSAGGADWVLILTDGCWRSGALALAWLMRPLVQGQLPGLVGLRLWATGRVPSETWHHSRCAIAVTAAAPTVVRSKVTPLARVMKGEVVQISFAVPGQGSPRNHDYRGSWSRLGGHPESSPRGLVLEHRHDQDGLGVGSNVASIASRARWSGPMNCGPAGALAMVVNSVSFMPIAGGRWVQKIAEGSRSRMV